MACSVQNHHIRSKRTETSCMYSGTLIFFITPTQFTASTQWITSYIPLRLKLQITKPKKCHYQLRLCYSKCTFKAKPKLATSQPASIVFKTACGKTTCYSSSATRMASQKREVDCRQPSAAITRNISSFVFRDRKRCHFQVAESVNDSFNLFVPL